MSREDLANHIIQNNGFETSRGSKEIVYIYYYIFKALKQFNIRDRMVDEIAYLLRFERGVIDKSYFEVIARVNEKELKTRRADVYSFMDSLSPRGFQFREYIESPNSNGVIGWFRPYLQQDRPKKIENVAPKKKKWWFL